jgi:hypothetical protein
MKFKKIELASTKNIDKHDKFATEFFKKIFGINNFLITDESSVYDFIGNKIHDEIIESDTLRTDNTEKVLKKIEKNYGVDVSKIKGLKLHKIFQEIFKQRHFK